jgi:UrcA family protein
MLSKPQLALLTMFSLGAAATPAAAQPAGTAAQEPEILVVRKLPPSQDRLIRAVYIGDLNLKSAAGQQEMEKRVGKAIEDMCAIPSPLPTYKEKMTKPCRDEAWSSARPQMESAVQRARGS